MLSTIHENQSLGEAGQELMAFILEPNNWVLLERLEKSPELRPGQNADYQRTVGALRICASVDVTEGLDAFLRIAFRQPGLNPARAADHLEEFLKQRLPLRPHTEWQVQVDSRKWIHFIRKLVGPALKA